jgi:hypothetical protein
MQRSSPSIKTAETCPAAREVGQACCKQTRHHIPADAWRLAACLSPECVSYIPVQLNNSCIIMYCQQQRHGSNFSLL